MIRRLRAWWARVTERYRVLTSNPAPLRLDALPAAPAIGWHVPGRDLEEVAHNALMLTVRTPIVGGHDEPELYV